MAKGATATRARTARGDAAGEPEMVQLLTPDGERIKLARDTHGNEYTVDFTDEEYRRLYRDMVVVRRLDTEADGPAASGRAGPLGPPARSGGGPGGFGRAMNAQDLVFPTYREHGVPGARGSTRSAPRLFRGLDLGGWDPSASLPSYTIVIGAQTLHAVGYAMGLERDGRSAPAIRARR